MKKVKLSPTKMSQDISPDKTPGEFYYEAYNMRVVANTKQTGFAFTNEKGNTFKIKLPRIDNVITGTGGTFNVKDMTTGALIESVDYTNNSKNSIPNLNTLRFNYAVNLRDDIVIFTSDLIKSGYCQVWLYDTSANTLSLKYNDKLDFTINTPIRKAITRYENPLVQKVYFTDAVNIFKYLNIADNNLINLDTSRLETTPDIVFTRPKLVEITDGGNFNAGVLQYAYSAYDENGVETKLSPFSDLITINNNDRGLLEGELVSRSYEMKIIDIPDNIKYLRVYRLYWENKDSLPEVKLIIDEAIDDNQYSFIDDNNLDLGLTTLEDILLLGGDPIICKDIETKDNVLFPVNITYNNFDIDFDTRAYAFDEFSNCTITDKTEPDITFDNTTLSSVTIPEKYDCINPSVKAETNITNLEVGEVENPDYYKYRFQADGFTHGVEGVNIKVTIKEKLVRPSTSYNSVRIDKDLNDSYVNPNTPKSLKRDEVYRIFIQFYNKKGQKTFSKWISDIRIPNQDVFPMTKLVSGDLFFSVLYLDVTLKNTPNSDEVVSYEILRSERTDGDKTIVSQGIVNAMVASPDNSGVDNVAFANRFMPSYITRTWQNNEHTFGRSFVDFGDLNTEIGSEYQGHYRMTTHIIQMFSPEIIYNNYSAVETDYYTIVGGLDNHWNRTWRYRHNNDDLIGVVIPGLGYKGSAESSISSPGRGFWWREGDGQHFGTFNTGYLTLANHSNNESNYRAIIRKGGEIHSTRIVKLPNQGTHVTDFSTGSVQSFTNVIGATKEFMDSIWVQRVQKNAKHKFEAHHSKCLTTQIKFHLNGIENALDLAVPKNSTGKFIIVDHKRARPNQYGGDTYEARGLNKPIVVSDIIPISQTTTSVYNGDTFISYFNLLRTRTKNPSSFIQNTSFKEVIMFPVETSINLDLRSDAINNSESELAKIETTFEDYYEMNPVYNLQKQYSEGLSRPFQFKEIEEFDTRILASDTKINGEVIDSWLKFRTNKYKDLNSEYGEITSIHEFNDELYAFQPEAISRVIINPRVYQQSSDNVSVLLGSGEILHDFVYLTTTSGSVNQYGVIKSPFGLYYIDALNKELSLISNRNEFISNLKGMHSHFTSRLNTEILKTDNPLIKKGITGYYDNEQKEVYFTILQDTLDNEDRHTITLNNLNNSFHNFQIFKPSIWINNRNKVFSTNDNLTSLYIHKTDNYGVAYDNAPEKSSITFIINQDSDFTKIYDTLLYNSKVTNGNMEIPLETLTSLVATNDYQEANATLTVGENVIRKFREWRIQLPREDGTRNRLRSQFLYLTLEFQNDGVKDFILYNAVMSYTLAPASFI